jgi:ABC-2 type transport system permease protein
MSTRATALPARVPTRPPDGGRARARTAFAAALRIGLSRALMEIKQFFRERDSTVFTFLFPVVMLFIFGSVFSGQRLPGDVTFTQYFAAGMIATGIMLSSFQQLAIGIAVERDTGTLKRLRGTPMPPVAYFLGKIGMVGVTSLVQAAVMVACGGALFGLDIPTDPDRWLRFAWIFALGTAAGTVLGIVYSSLPRSARSASAVVTPVLIVLQFISGVYFIFSELPEWMRNVGSVFPLKWLTQGMRSVFLPESFAAQEPAGTWELGRTALVLVVWAVVGLALSLRTFRWQRGDDR